MSPIIMLSWKMARKNIDWNWCFGRKHPFKKKHTAFQFRDIYFSHMWLFLWFEMHGLWIRRGIPLNQWGGPSAITACYFDRALISALFRWWPESFPIPSINAMTGPNGAARLMVLHGSHQEIPPWCWHIYIYIYQHQQDPSWDRMIEVL